MKLAQKGQSAPLPQLTGLTATLSWSIAADFDIAALYRKNDGTEGLIYFGEEVADGMAKSEDKGVGDQGGANAEVLFINDLSGKSEIHLICWDYGMVQKGARARFSDSDVQLEVVDNAGTQHQVTLAAGPLGNVCVVATIKVGEHGGELINASKAGTLKGLTDTQQLWDIANQ